MRVSKYIAVLAGLGLAALAWTPAMAKSAAELEKEKALANPYPNDFGPDHLPADYVASLPPNMKKGYELLLTRCSQCHTSARPLNSRFVEPNVGFAMAPAARDQKEAAEVAKLKASHPEYFKEKGVWQIEAGVWARYVKRMLNKPGCGVAQGGHMTPPEAKQIYEFLVFDGSQRKLGANAAKWKAHREELINELKAKKPSRYKELAEDNDL